MHGIKFQSIVRPNGVITSLYGPTEGSRHDRFMLARTRILDQLEHFSFGPHREILCIYGWYMGDTLYIYSVYPAHLLIGHLQTPSRGTNLVPLQISWNKEMSSVHVSVKRVFGGIINYFKFLDFWKKPQGKIKFCGQNVYCLCGTSQCDKLLLWHIDTKLFCTTTTTDQGIFPLINTKTFINFGIFNIYEIESLKPLK